MRNTNEVTNILRLRVNGKTCH